ncbi:MAG: winged helix-turn-helix domain-containing protein, partial [Luteimonas sp.]|nr:winged helix-turn-helix domain-containing protein [Luteimonas sp.]
MRRVVVRADGGSLRLTVKAMQVLLVLVEQRGAVVSRETMFERVWPDTMPTDDVLTQAVTQLRKAFADDRDAPRYIETISKVGYRLVADVAWVDAGGAAPGGTQAEPPDGIVDAGACAALGEGQAPPPASARPTRTWLWPAVGAAALLVGLAVL